MSISYHFVCASSSSISKAQTRIKYSKVESNMCILKSSKCCCCCCFSIARFTHLNANGYCIYTGWPGMLVVGVGRYNN